MNILCQTVTLFYLELASLFQWKSKTRVTSYKLRLQVLELRVHIYELQVQIHKLRVQIHALRVQIYELRGAGVTRVKARVGR